MATEGPEYSPFFAVMGASAAMVFSGNYQTITSLIFMCICMCKLLFHQWCCAVCFCSFIFVCMSSCALI